jgi:uncharacterized protein (TIGR03083 family)
MSDLWSTIHAERRSLADEVSNLSPEQWQTPTMCVWTVHEVLAHLTATAKMTPAKFFANMAGAGFKFDDFTAKQVVKESAGGPDATLAEFRAVSGRTSAPPGPKDTWLGEALVHGEDIRRALGIAHSYAPEDAARVLTFYSKSNAIIGGKRRIQGLTMKATDADFSLGTGPEVHGPIMSLVLAATGRKAALDDLGGPGLETLRSRT